jgi:hypothetical protein
MTMGLLRRKDKSEEEIAEDLTHEQNVAEALRLSEEMSDLTTALQKKIAELKKELDQ